MHSLWWPFDAKARGVYAARFALGNAMPFHPAAARADAANHRGTSADSLKSRHVGPLAATVAL